MKYLFVFLFIICIHKSQAQYYGDDSISQARNQIIFQSDYWENFNLYKSGKLRIAIDASSINIPFNNYREIFQVKRDSLVDIEIQEVGESEKIMFAGYKIHCTYSYYWPSGNPNKRNEVESEAKMSFFFWNHDYEEFVDSMIFELYKSDSLRCILHKRLRAKHEAYIMRRMSIAVNIEELLSRVKNIKVYKHDVSEKPPGYIYPEYKAIYEDTIIVMYDKLLRSIKDKQKTELVKLLSSDAEWMTEFNYYGFVPEYSLLLSDKDNKYVGKIRITGPLSAGDGLALSLKVSNNYFYHTSALKYKGFNEIRAIVVK